jgi:hypothetical protein
VSRKGKGKRFTEADLAALRAKVAGGGAQDGKATDGKRKYNNEPVYVGTMKFASKKEAKRYQVLRFLELKGEITDLKTQVRFELAPAVDLGGKRKKPAMRYFADFTYTVVATGAYVVEDAKGFRTRQYLDRKHLMMTVHGILIQEV